jgi:hypothetical protein
VASLRVLDPALAGIPANRATGAHVNERLRILVGQTRSPVDEALVSETLGVWILKGSLKFGAATALQFVTDRLSHELAPVLLPPIDIAQEVSG